MTYITLQITNHHYHNRNQIYGFFICFVNMVHDFLLSNKIISFILYLANVMKFDIHSASPSIPM